VDPKLSRFKSAELSRLGHHAGKVPEPKTTDELKVALQTIWKELPREHINKAVVNFTKHLTASMVVAVNSGHYEYLH